MKNALKMAMIGLAITIPMTCRAQDTTSGAKQPAGSTQGTPQSTTNGLSSQQMTSLQAELDELKAKIAQIEAEIKAGAGQNATAPPQKTAAPAQNAVAPAQNTVVPAATTKEAPAVAVVAAAPAATDFPAETTTEGAPFPGDWSWLNAQGRVVDFPLATKYFTPEFRSDVNYILDFNHPEDDTMGGSTESFRSNEFQLEQLSFGGDIRVQNVRGRFLTMFGEFATTTPRNDASYSRGQWDLADAYRYVSEAWGGYHWDKLHGINLDAGIFVSYIGLFSYYNADNWAYQPSFVSSNTPWFFTGVRGQVFVTKNLKIEPWFINGWQSYARSNGKPGLGGQILWHHGDWLDLVFNNYGLGEDALGVPYRHRYHTDDSIQVKYYDNKSHFIDKAAFTFTADAGCEVGVGTNPVDAGTNVACHGDKPAPASAGGGTAYKQYFIGYMEYNRVWWDKDKYAFTLGGGQMSNPGRYLTLLPPINGATATSGTPYFTENPGDKYTAWDTTGTIDYMPNQFITFRTEVGYRHASVPYWTGRGGITPPGGNNGSPADYACSTGASSGVGFSGGLAAAQAACGGPAGSTSSIWFPDLRRDQLAWTTAIMVRF
ncbi:outer membrane beta-barrel protein [Granulicella sp. L46]|uniref:outer membrane beta-barrel protein n=1 Tax=Granulicella sp. L46 TaxID=1641865 RepID=UPI0020B13ADB|nr:outer membrane beta-barrel protein [Granulicella sp. L46]